MLKFAKAAALTIVCLTFASRANASALVYQQVVDPSPGDAGAFSQPDQQLAGSFVLGAGAVVDSAFWYGTMFSADPLDTGDTWNFDVVFYADASGLPGLVLQTASIVASVTDTGFDKVDFSFGAERLYRFDANFAALALGGGTTYWF